MPEHEVPDTFLALVRDLAAENVAQNRESVREEAEERERERERDRQREAALPAAEGVLRWASALATSGTLDGLGDASLQLYEHRTRGGVSGLCLYRDGTLEAWIQDARTVAATALDLVSAVPVHVIEDLASAIDSGEIWPLVTQLNRLR